VNKHSPLFLSHSLWTSPSKHPYCGWCECSWWIVAVAGQSAQHRLWRSFLRRIPHQQWMGADGSSLFTWVKFTSKLIFNSFIFICRRYLVYCFVLLTFMYSDCIQDQHVQSACVLGKEDTAGNKSQWSPKNCENENRSPLLQQQHKWQWHRSAAPVLKSYLQ